MTANEALLKALIEHAEKLEDLTQDEYKTILVLLEAAHAEALGHISTLWQDKDIGEIATRVNMTYSEVTSKIKAAMDKSLPRLADNEVTQIQAMLEEIIPGVAIKGAMVEWQKIAERPAAAGSTLAQLVDALGVNNMTDVVETTKRAIEQGKTLEQLIVELRGRAVRRAKWVGGKYVAGKYTGGIMTVDTRQAEALARTAVMHVTNSARDVFWQANEDIIKGYMRVETLDERTCIECGIADGTMYGVNEPRPFLPSHVNCRGIMVPVFKSFRELGIDADELPATTRASMNGQVPKYTTWKDMLESASPKEQAEILGPTRAKLYQQGMPVESFVKDGKLLTLKELK